MRDYYINTLMLSIIMADVAMLSVIMANVIMLSVIMLNVVAPCNQQNDTQQNGKKTRHTQHIVSFAVMPF
jgi:hypothetical protein